MTSARTALVTGANQGLGRARVQPQPAPQNPDDPNQHRAALAYASDYSILEPVLRAHGIAWSTPGLKVASLDHAMWWHRDARVDEWLLFVQESPSAGGGRGLTLGRIYTRAGRRGASGAPEGMVRVPPGAATD